MALAGEPSTIARDTPTPENKAWRELVRLSKKIYRLTGELHAFAPRNYIKQTPANVFDKSAIADYHARGLWPPSIERLELMSARLAHPFPSSPIRNPKYGVRFRSTTKFFHLTFSAEYSAKKFIETVLRHHEHTWQDDDTIVITSLPHRLRITSEVPGDLATIMEYQYSQEEADWELPIPYSTQAYDIAEVAKPVATPEKAAKNGRGSPHTGPEPPRPAKPSRKQPKRLSGQIQPKSPRDPNAIDLATICAEIGVDPRNARMILRRKAGKPPSGRWEWPQEEVAAIKRMLKP